LDRIPVLLETEPAFLYLLLGLLGACVGSFLNVVIYRLPAALQHQWKTRCGELQHTPISDTEPPGIVSPRSRCPKCLTPLSLHHNLPIIGYLVVKGRCAACRQRISPRYPLVELLTLLLSIHAGIVFGPGWPLVFSLIFIWMLIALCFIDFDHQLLPDNLTLSLMWVGMLANYFEIFTTLEDSVIGAIAGYLSLWLIYQTHRLLTGKQGMGYGDFKLLAAIGAWLGWQYLPLVVLLASVIGTVVGLVAIFGYGKRKEIPIAFGPYLAIAGWGALIWGASILERYLQFAASLTLW